MQIEITVAKVLNVDPHERNRCSVGLDMTDAQVFCAIEELLGAGGLEKRAQRLAQLLDNELSGMTA
ncbi:hypothetical protein VLK31_34755 [Variovorax sp. H27-G14]|uniref:hypothetical protein n=1 Tax=Variovorax sp. H27-G14 TaxID=3111914 RepID=UPI0038FC79E3